MFFVGGVPPPRMFSHRRSARLAGSVIESAIEENCQVFEVVPVLRRSKITRAEAVSPLLGHGVVMQRMVLGIDT